MSKDIEGTKTIIESSQVDSENVENNVDAQGSEDPNESAQPDYTAIIGRQSEQIEAQGEQIKNLLSQIDALIRNGVPVTSRTAGEGNANASHAANPAFSSSVGSKHEGMKVMSDFTFDDFKI